MATDISTKNALKEVQSKLSQVTVGAAHTVMLFDANGTPTGKASAQQLISDMTKVGFAFGTCSTAATATAKTVATADFILCKMGIVSVLFTNAIDAAGATLNVNSTGAKAIYAMGSPIQPGLVRPQTVVQMQYDGTRFNIVGMFGLEQSATADDELTVDLGLPSGLLWAKANIDLTTPSKLQEVDGKVSPFRYGCSFVSWGNTKMYNPNEETNSFAGVYNWGGVNEADPYYEGQVYGDTKGNSLTANIAPSQDCARVNLGTPWHMPLSTDFQELIDNCSYLNADGSPMETTQTNKLVEVNSVKGIWLQGPNGNRIFFACSGYGTGASWYNRSSHGYCWSRSFHSARYARYLYFYSGGVTPQDLNLRYYGFAVRPVQ